MTANALKVTAAEPAPKATANDVSLPECIEPLTADGHRPSLIVGTVSGGDWLPPVALSDAQAAALATARAEIERALAPAAPEAARALLSRLAMNVRLEDVPEQAWQLHLDDFIADLADVPEDLIAEACGRWRRREKFWPLISEFLSLIRVELRERRATLRRLEVLERVRADPAPDGVATREWLDRVMGARTPGPSRVAGMRPLGQVLAGMK